MNAPATKRTAWQPFTPRGVAAFSDASFDRFQLAKFLAALFCSCSVVAFLWRDWAPVLLETVQAMPETARMEQGELKGLPDPVLKENRFVSMLVGSDDARETGQTADVQLAFGRIGLELCALRGRVGSLSLGCAAAAYSRGWNLPLGRSVLEPWWGAWRGMIFAAVGLGVFLALVVSWVLLAMLYALPVRALAFAAQRRITWSGSWRLAGAALIPGALFLSLGLWAYGFYLIDLVRFLLIFGLHFVVGWAYLIAAPLALDRLESGETKPAAPPGKASKKPKSADNPFTT
jgi:hypothetical protein